jgi:decaprenyl-phosphate phosphoribosyltransferase
VSGHLAGGPGPYLRLLRPRQWVKNVLVVAVPLAAGRLLDPELIRPILTAFVAFCLASSAAYAINDVRDAAADREHPVKRTRPVAAGQVPASTAVLLGAVLAVAAVAVAVSASTELAALVGGYLVIAVSYTLWLQDQPVLDLAVVASGFVLRALGGGVAAEIPPSQWFLLAAAFGALFMVAGKRYADVLRSDAGGALARTPTAYRSGYLRFVWTLAATVTITTYALWGFELHPSLARPVLVQVSTVPFVLAILRYAVVIEQGAAGEPETVVLRDRGLQVIATVWLVLFGLGVTGG